MYHVDILTAKCNCPYGINTFKCQTSPHETARSICTRNCDHAGSAWRARPIRLKDGSVVARPVFTSSPLKKDALPELIADASSIHSDAEDILSKEFIESLGRRNQQCTAPVS